MALHRILRKPPATQTRADEGLLGSPHLALTVAGLPCLARATAGAAAAASLDGVGDGGKCGDVLFRSPEFVAAVAARVGERVGGMQEWEREMVVGALRALGGKGERGGWEG
jgi:hypothetical protein